MANPSPPKTIVVGDEYDSRLRHLLNGVMLELGGQMVNTAWGIAGSQEIETVDFLFDDRTIRVTVETYIGLSIHGPADLVETVAGLLAARKAEAGSE